MRKSHTKQITIDNPDRGGNTHTSLALARHWVNRGRASFTSETRIRFREDAETRFERLMAAERSRNFDYWQSLGVERGGEGDVQVEWRQQTDADGFTVMQGTVVPRQYKHGTRKASEKSSLHQGL